MANAGDAIRILAKQAYLGSKPTQRVFGTVSKIDPLEIQINEKLVLKGSFLKVTQTVKNYLTWGFIEVGDKVVMTMQQGGQLFIVDDMLACDKDFDKHVIMSHTHDYLDTTIHGSSTGKSEMGVRIK